MSAFDRLAPFIREFIWQSGWKELRDVQETAIGELLDGGGHVIIAAGTASGKTEAAFFPILTNLAEDPPRGFGALYVGPLKALINDQFSRIEELLDEADMPVFAWHGDRPESEKARAKRDPHGVLQITPESLEGLLMRQSGLAARMFAGLRFIIIDELHAFMGTDRGLQLQCQLCRIDRLVGHGVRRVGLSATIADYGAAQAWLSAGTELDTVVVESRAGGKKLDITLQNYLVEPRRAGKGETDAAMAEPVAEEANPTEPVAEEARETAGADAADQAPDMSTTDAVPEASGADPQDEPSPDVPPALPALALNHRPTLTLGDDGPDALAQAEDALNSAESALRELGMDPSEADAPAKEAVPEGDSPDANATETNLSENDAPAPDLPAPDEARLYADLYRLVRGRRCLVFTNSRAETETVVAALRAEAEKAGEPDVFHAHHGSLSAAIRSDAEEAMKAAEGPAVAVATRTLELGIDLGKLDRVIQLGAADTCAGFVQRLGRSGRRGQPSVMRFLTREKPAGKTPFEDLPWELLKSVAIVQLYLEERWVEPFEDKPLPYSLLFQQIIAALMPGELTSRALAKRVHTLPAFRNIPAEDYMTLLRHMLDTDMLTRMETGTLLPGLAGERLAADYRFLSVFADGGGCRVICGDREIGSIDSAPEVGATFAMAGRSWRVVETDGRGAVYVAPASGGAEAGWQSGGAGVHDRVVEKQRDILLSDADYAYLRPEARAALARARETAAGYDLDRLFTPLGGGRLLLHPFLGSRKLDTLAYLLRGRWSNALLIQTVKPAASKNALLVETLLPRGLFLKRLRACLEALDPEDLVENAPAERRDRNDPYLPDALLKRAYVYNALDVAGLRDALLARPELAELSGTEDGDAAPEPPVDGPDPTPTGGIN